MSVNAKLLKFEEKRRMGLPFSSIRQKNNTSANTPFLESASFPILLPPKKEQGGKITFTALFLSEPIARFELVTYALRMRRSTS